MKTRTVSTWLVAVLILATFSTAFSQTALIGLDQYAFQLTTQPNIGMYFSGTDQRYELRDASGAAAFWLKPQTSQAMFRGKVSINTNTLPNANLEVYGESRFGSLSNYGSFNADGDLEFTGNGDYLVGNNRYAFRAEANENFGIFFNATDVRYEFRDGASIGKFYVDAQSGSIVSSGFVRVGMSFNSTAGNIRFNGTDFQGYDGVSWKSLTGVGGGGVDNDWAYSSGSGLSGSVYHDGTVSIGSSSVAAGYQLNVDGKIIAEEILVRDSGIWPDYVFDADYELLPIAALRSSIARDGHLPGMPSAEKVERDGIALGEMQTLLLREIEELNRYVIQLHERVERLEVENAQLKAGEIESLDSERSR